MLLRERIKLENHRFLHNEKIQDQINGVYEYIANYLELNKINLIKTFEN